MKTNNVQKTENRNFRKSAIKLLAVVTGLVAFSMTINANATSMKQTAPDEDQHLLAYAMFTEVSHQATSTHSTTTSLTDVAAESAIELEKWMTEESFFVAQEISFEAESDEIVEVEEWMVNNENFNTSESKTDKEIALTIEGWMLDESIWGM